MPDLTKATSVSKARRGYRTVKMTLPVSEFDLLTRIGGESFRTPDQQAAYYVHQALIREEAAAIKTAVREAEYRRDADNGELEDVEVMAQEVGEVGFQER